MLQGWKPAQIVHQVILHLPLAVTAALNVQQTISVQTPQVALLPVHRESIRMAGQPYVSHVLLVVCVGILDRLSVLLGNTQMAPTVWIALLATCVHFQLRVRRFVLMATTKLTLDNLVVSVVLQDIAVFTRIQRL